MKGEYTMKKALIIANILFTSVTVFGMENYAQAVRERSEQNQRLESALRLNNLEKVAQSIDEGADINMRIFNGRTPLTFAINEDNFDLASILIGLGADVNLKDGKKETPLTISIHNRLNRILDMLLQCENIDLETPGVWGLSPLGVAMEMDSQAIDIHNDDSFQLKMTEKLLQAGAKADGIADIDNLDSPLMRVMMYCDKSMANLLLKYGADVNAKNKYGDTAAALASRWGHNDMLELLFPKQHEVILLQNEGKNKNVSAFTDNQIASMKIRANINEKNDNGYTFLMIALEEGQSQTAEYLINLGIDVNLKNKAGRTALMFAAKGGFIEIVRLLLKKGVRTDLVDDYGYSALRFAEEKGHNDIVEILRNAQ